MITVPEAARRCGRNAETIRRWIRSGRLHSRKVGTQYLIREEDLATLADDSTVVDLVPAWRQATDGSPMPPWEQLVRDARRSH